MIENSNNFKLHKLLLNSLTLDSFEYFYLYPLLEQAGLYAGNINVVFLAQKLSQQTKNSSHLKEVFQKSLQKSLQNSDECIKQKDHIYFFLQNKVYGLEFFFQKYENVLIKYHHQHVFLDIYVYYVYSSFGKYFYEILKPTINHMVTELSKQHSQEENLCHCLQYILIYKTWKIEYWYSSISKLAFDCKEIGIAKFFIQMTKLEYNMIFILLNLLKPV